MPNANYLALTTMQGQILCSLQVGTGEQTVYTVPPNSTVRVSHGTLCNTSGATVTVSLSLLPSGATVDATHRVISVYPLAAGDTVSLRDYLDGHMMAPGDFISVNASAAGTIDVILSGTVSS